MRYVAANTTIPVPRVVHYGTAAENPTGLGPFIIMDYIEHHRNMSRALLDPRRPIDERPVLDPGIGQEKLEFLYSQIANILLQLSSLNFPRIGSLAQEHEGDSITVGRRPFATNMNELIIHTNMPTRVFPSQTYGTAEEWYGALVDMHMAQLALQHNDTTENDDDVRDKYVARKLFRRLVDANNLWPDQGPSARSFKLFFQGLRPADVLLDEDLRVVGVIDWEFAYAAPAEFTFDPPWWLLLLEPEYWPGGYSEWMKVYEPRFHTFLRMLEAEEKKMAAGTSGVASLPDNDGGAPAPLLSQSMRKSWEERTWMVNYAVRSSWAFDFIWWKFLDERYFGPNEDQDHRARLHLLSEPQKAAMSDLVAAKADERLRRMVFEWDEALAVDRLNRLLA
ncbi:phosphotransferase family protein [Durotheca rogersii]|uniref:phosphotransferase family protein n=1 Tax=Durotheca rogersii TaxID=419775 RepID=UPI00221F20BF|nr:phosphotransferase family protein [Durotheca rogersii]KAI5860384.1 phosphotransferase family protein [Durotheca rogersii]